MDDALSWQKSTTCGTSACVEVVLGPDEVLVRDSKDPGVMLSFSRAEWLTFVAGVRAGEFDAPPSDAVQ